jgi:anaphase-promoting complex subunit 6
VLHEALAVSPQDPMATELLAKALEATSDAKLNLNLDGSRVPDGLDDDAGEEFGELERRLNGSLREIEGNRVAGRRGRRRRVEQLVVDEEEGESGFGESMVVDSDEG